MACEGEILRLVRSTMLFSDDMFDVVGKLAVFFE